MKKVNIAAAKAQLSECIEAALNGEQVIICRRNRPVAELRPVAAIRKSPRPVGGVTGFIVPESFFDPLPAEVIDSFYEIRDDSSSRVAEAPTAPPRGASRTRRSKR